MTRACWSMRMAVAIIAIGALLASPTGGAAQSPNDEGVIQHVTIPAGQVFSCGVGFSFTQVGISIHGNVQQFASPAGSEHILVAFLGSGYQVAYQVGSIFAPFTTAHDFGGGAEAGWSAAVSVSQPNGANTFPLEITRITADGVLQVTRRITGNSFVGAVPAGTPNFDDVNADGVACDVLGECGNCTNRTIHVLTRVRNLSTTAAVFNIRVVEAVDFDIDGSPGDNRFGRSTDAVFAYQDVSQATAGPEPGMLLQTLILPAITQVGGCCGYEIFPPANAVFAGVATPTAPGDFEAILRQDAGSLAACGIAPCSIFGPSTGNNVRLHYRRF